MEILNQNPIAEGFKQISAMRYYRKYGMETTKLIYPAQIKFIAENEHREQEELETSILKSIGQ